MDGCHSKVNGVRMLENISKIKRFDVKFTLVEISVTSTHSLDKHHMTKKKKIMELIKESLVAETFRNKYRSGR